MDDHDSPLEFALLMLFLVLAALVASSQAGANSVLRCRPVCNSVGLDTVRDTYPDCACGGSGPVRLIRVE